MEDLVDDVHVAVPWFGRDPHREAALAWVARRWTEAGFGVTLGIPDGEVWVKAEAVSDAIGASTAPIVAVADADCWSTGVTEAVEHVRNGAAWAIPHHRVYRLTRESTAEVLAGAEPHERMELEPFADGLPGFGYTGVQGGGIVILRRDVYDTCPLDPRFRGWGQEDESWALALNCLHGPPVRLTYPLWHLWHPPQQRQSRGVGSDAGMALYKRYARAKRRPDVMRALIAEGAADADCQRDSGDAGDVGVGAPGCVHRHPASW